MRPALAAAEPVASMPLAPIDRIIAEVSRAFGVSKVDVVSKRKGSKNTRARFAVYYLARQTTPKSLAAIGNAMSFRDHTTVMYGIGAAERVMAADAEYRELVLSLEQKLAAEFGTRTEAEGLVDDILHRLRLRMMYEARRDPEGLVKRLSALFGATLFALFTAAAPARADGPVACAQRADLLRLARDTAGEAPVAMGLRGDGRLMEIWARADGASWSVVVSDPSGISCRVVSGTAWGRAPQAEPEGVEH